jgi:hypothetical protein
MLGDKEWWGPPRLARSLGLFRLCDLMPRGKFINSAYPGGICTRFWGDCLAEVGRTTIYERRRPGGYGLGESVSQGRG